MIFIVVLLFILGSAIGSFLNVVIDRVPRGKSIFGRSCCDYCRRTLNPLDLVPVISFATLGGRCRYCKNRLSFQYPLVETIMGLLFVGIFLKLTQDNILSTVHLVYFFIVISTVIVTAFIDLKFSLIPTSFVYATSLISLFFNYFFLSSNIFVEHIIAAFAAALFFLAIVVLTRGRGMGEGDIVFGFLMGIVLGPKNVTLAIFLAFLLGAIVALFLLASGKKKFGQAIPFAPFLVSGFLISLFWGDAIVAWYLLSI